WRSVYAEQPISKNSLGSSFYYEVKISGRGNGIFIGLATKQMQLESPGERFYAYSSTGKIWGHEVEGCTHTQNGRLFISKNPAFGVGDVIGCAVDLATGQIIYTKNGARFGEKEKKE
uniref:B30.2/SPRY domain-containing protein n=1 Tax=Globodera pallida TaxID=36090 RepID=A0A183CD74_GLOPA